MHSLIVVLTGPSDSGKTTLAEYLVQKFGFIKPTTYTTRKPRSEETKSSYCFISEEDFLSKIQQNEMAEYVTNFGYYYGCTKKSFQTEKNIAIALDYRGAQRIKELYPDRSVVICLNVSKKVMLERMHQRSKICDEQIQKRLEEYDRSTKYVFDYILDNNFSQLETQNCITSILSSLIEGIEKKNNHLPENQI